MVINQLQKEPSSTKSLSVPPRCLAGGTGVITDGVGQHVAIAENPELLLRCGASWRPGSAVSPAAQCFSRSRSSRTAAYASDIRGPIRAVGIRSGLDAGLLAVLNDLLNDLLQGTVRHAGSSRRSTAKSVLARRL